MAETNIPPLPLGWKMFNKYQIRHTDGTPLKGKDYFVLRLDSDDPAEASRVSAAMAAYKGHSQAAGVAASVREAAEQIRNHAKHINSVLGNQSNEAIEQSQRSAGIIARIADRVLATPPRNCDREECRDFRDSCSIFDREVPGPRRLWGEVYWCELGKWLLATSTKQKGESDGSK